MQAEIKAEYIEEQKEDNIIELRIQLETLLDEQFPIKQAYDEIRHRIEKLKLRISNANTKYFERKGM
jgi:hypothetical protein